MRCRCAPEAGVTFNNPHTGMALAVVSLLCQHGAAVHLQCILARSLVYNGEVSSRLKIDAIGWKKRQHCVLPTNPQPSIG